MRLPVAKANAARLFFNLHNCRFDKQSFAPLLITNCLPASISSVSGWISQCRGHPPNHGHNKRKSLSVDLIAVSRGLCGTVLLFGLIRNDRPVFCTSAREIELEEEVWTCGVDRFSQRARKFESKAPAADISAVMELFSLHKQRNVVCHVACTHPTFSTQPT